MIQGAINQLIAFGAAAKKVGDIAEAKERKEIQAQYRTKMARDNAMQRASDAIRNKYDQSRAYKDFMKSLESNKAPDELKRIAFEATHPGGVGTEKGKKDPQVTIGGVKVDISKLSPEAQKALRGGNNG